MCPPCDNELKSEAIIEHLCASEFGKKASLAASGRLGIPDCSHSASVVQSLLEHLFGDVYSLPPSSPDGCCSQADGRPDRMGNRPVFMKVKLGFCSSVCGITRQVWGNILEEWREAGLGRAVEELRETRRLGLASRHSSSSIHP